MISSEIRVQIRHWFYAEHWKIGTIAQELGVHPDTVRPAIEPEPLPPRASSASLPHRSLLRVHPPDLGAVSPIARHAHLSDDPRTRLPGSVVQLRRAVARLRPSAPEPFLRLHMFPAEQAQVDWAHFGEVPVGRARRRLSCFLITLSYSRALYLEFFFDQTMENFLRGHVHAFQAWAGSPRMILHDNLRSAVLERRGDQIHFHPRFAGVVCPLPLLARPCQVRAGNQKGRVERAIRYVRESFWAGRDFTTLEECNRQALLWRDQVAHQRPWPGDDSRTVAQAFAEEQPRLLPCPSIPSTPIWFFPFVPPRPSMSALTSTITPSRPKPFGRPLTLVASDTWMRILDGTQEIARHRRTFDRHQSVLDPAHQQALLEEKRKAFRLDAQAVGLPKPCRKAKPCWISPSPVGNRRAAKPPSCSNCWTPTVLEACAVPSQKRWSGTRPVLLRWPSCCARRQRSEHPPPHPSGSQPPPRSASH